MRMALRFRLFLAVAALPMLCACPGPSAVNSASAASACSTALNAAATIEQLAQIFVNAGIEPARAAKVAAAVRTFQMPATVACALIPPPKAP